MVNEEAQRRHLVFIDAVDPEKSNYTRYINHSSTNANLRILTISKSQQKQRRRFSRSDPCRDHGIAMITSTFVMKDEKLLFDYGAVYDAPWK